MVFSQGFALFRSYAAWFQTKIYVYFKDYAPLGLLCFQFNLIHPYVIDYLKLHNFSLTAMPIRDHASNPRSRSGGRITPA